MIFSFAGGQRPAASSKPGKVAGRGKRGPSVMGPSRAVQKRVNLPYIIVLEKTWNGPFSGARHGPCK